MPFLLGHPQLLFFEAEQDEPIMIDKINNKNMYLFIFFTGILV
jgi:hypothetical protein